MKYKVNVYYEYVASIDVEADTPEQARDLGYDIADGLFTEDLDFVGYSGTEVTDDKFNIILEE